MTRVAFFFDRSFPKRIARMIVQYEVDYETRYQDDDPRFRPDMLDVDIIDILAADTEYHWVMVSKDRKVTTRPGERAVLDRAKLQYVYCDGKAWARKSDHEQAWQFVRLWPTLVQRVLSDKGRVFEIEGANMKVTRVG